MREWETDWNLPGLRMFISQGMSKPANILATVAIVMGFGGCLLATFVNFALGATIALPGAAILAVLGVQDLQRVARAREERELRRAMAHERIERP